MAAVLVATATAPRVAILPTPAIPIPHMGAMVKCLTRSGRASKAFSTAQPGVVPTGTPTALDKLELSSTSPAPTPNAAAAPK